jgi:ribose transport system permease protein
MQSRANAATAATPGLPRLKGFDWRNYVVYVFFAAVLLFFGLTIGDKGFLTVPNLFNITRTTAMIAVIAVAMTFVISAGELDLSVGSTAALAALTAGLVMQAGFGPVAGVAAALGAGLLVGLINGFFVTVMAIPSSS